MNPNGLVAAASMISQTSMFMRRTSSPARSPGDIDHPEGVLEHFTISATRVELTGTTVSERLRVEQRSQAGTGRGDAADHLGNVHRLILGVAGSTARRKAQEELVPARQAGF